MVVAVQCPNPKCRKFMLVEEVDSKKVVTCLLCKTPFRLAGAAVNDSDRSRDPPDLKKS
jgi:hypothetical protein